MLGMFRWTATTSLKGKRDIPYEEVLSLTRGVFVSIFLEVLAVW